MAHTADRLGHAAWSADLDCAAGRFLDGGSKHTGLTRSWSARRIFVGPSGGGHQVVVADEFSYGRFTATGVAGAFCRANRQFVPAGNSWWRRGSRGMGHAEHAWKSRYRRGQLGRSSVGLSGVIGAVVRRNGVDVGVLRTHRYIIVDRQRHCFHSVLTDRRGLPGAPTLCT